MRVGWKRLDLAFVRLQSIRPWATASSRYSKDPPLRSASPTRSLVEPPPDVRVGLHTGEIELLGEDIGGIAVAIARRVSDLAGPGEVWVSGTVPGVVFASGIQFRERGNHPLKGVPGEWLLCSVETV